MYFQTNVEFRHTANFQALALTGHVKLPRYFPRNLHRSKRKMDVIALISGGKDSFFSLLHCIANGHRIVALANLHPPIPNSSSQVTTYLPTSEPFFLLVDGHKDELDSFMYQTVGHGLLPFYPNALGVPLYRYPIIGSSVDQNLSYKFSGLGFGDSGDGDETEDLVPLLRYILERHPTVKAISTGAILSTYQRTRIESVCERLRLISLSYLWQRKQEEILEEMDIIGLDARIVKVAAVGLDAEKWIWRNVADVKNRKLLEGLQKKWGVHVAGEGGEYETIVVDGPGWKGRIEVGESEREIVDGGGGVGHAKILNAKFILREGKTQEQEEWVGDLKKPSLWDPEFEEILEALEERKGDPKQPESIITLDGGEKIPSKSVRRLGKVIFISNLTATSFPTEDILQEVDDIMTSLSEILDSYETDFSRITSTTLLLRSMTSFDAANRSYSSRFTTPNPPSRVCVSVGNGLPAGVNVMLSVIVDLPVTESEEYGRRKGLHVQSRSYWAPANIGPYSQSVSVDGWTTMAGMIPLVPAGMEAVNAGVSTTEMEVQAVLALQHMWRVAKAVNVVAILGCVVYVVDGIGMDAAWRAWMQLWRGWRGEGGFRGLWGAEEDESDDQNKENGDAGDGLRPPLLIVSVEELPRSCAVEWAGIGLESTWLEKVKRIHEDENDDDRGAFLRDKWGIQSGAELSIDKMIASSSMWYGGWSEGRCINVPFGGGGGIKMLFFHLSNAKSETERISALVEDVATKVVGEEMGFLVGGIVVYIPAATGTAGNFMETWDKVDDSKVAVQVVPVRQVWDYNGMGAGLGVVFRMCGPLYNCLARE